MRVDGRYGYLGSDLGVDNFVKGSTHWKKVEVVLDVPETAVGIAFGVMLDGKGKLLKDDVQFDIVNKVVPRLGMPHRWKKSSTCHNTLDHR